MKTETFRTNICPKDVPLIKNSPPDFNLFKQKSIIYQDYVVSKAWKHKKKQYYEHNDKKCYVCSSHKDIKLHHSGYHSLGREKNVDLKPLCGKHHNEFHNFYNPSIHKSYKKALERFKNNYLNEKTFG